MPEGEQPVTKIEPLPWMTAAPTRAVLAALGSGNARFAGGPVRDALLGRDVVDIDIATSLEPEEVMRRLAAAGIAVVPTGLAHGTVTAVIAPRHFEITTLRRDVETFGRHARVEFTADWAADARRRDFTMNALYLDAAGAVFDHVGGLADLRAGRVRFVGDARERIREDVLRLLRFYRFSAHYAAGPFDEDGRAAARELKDLLPRLSAERVAAELLKLLAASDPAAALALMAEDGVLARILPEARGLALLAALVPLEPAPDPVRRLAALVADDARSAEAAARRLKLKTSERARIVAIAAPPFPVMLSGDDATQRRALYRLGAARYADLVLMRAAAEGKGARATALLAFAAAWKKPRFPLKGADLVARGLAPGPEVGELLGAIELWWEAGDFRADRKAALAELERRMGRHG
ncbi:MAG TPA: CCA tRNA nucleotidyltransferase [Stellaceae bacterium]|nr:CCA tRNA nucleotidyltransferase [Stellaceae bacterium]